MSETSKLRRRLRRKVARDEQLTPGQEREFLRLMKVETTGPSQEFFDRADQNAALVRAGIVSGRSFNEYMRKMRGEANG